MKLHISDYEAFQKRIYEMLKTSHENLQAGMGEKIMGGFKSICDGFSNQSLGDKQEILGAVENIVKISSQKIYDSCQLHVDTQIAQFCHTFEREVQVAFSASGKRFQDLEKDCLAHFAAMMGRIANLESGLTN